MPDADAARDAILAEARERTAAMSAQEKRQLITHLRDNWAEDPAAASAFLSVDTTAATTLLVALLELGLLSEEAVQQVAREDAEIQQSSAAVVTQQRADDGYTQYQLELLRQVSQHAAARDAALRTVSARTRAYALPACALPRPRRWWVVRRCCAFRWLGSRRR